MNFLLSSHQSFAIDVRLIGQLPLPLRRCLLRFPFCLPLNNCAGLIFQIVKLSMQQAMVLAPSWCVRPISPVAKVTFEVTVPIFKNCSIFWEAYRHNPNSGLYYISLGCDLQKFRDMQSMIVQITWFTGIQKKFISGSQFLLKRNISYTHFLGDLLHG